MTELELSTAMEQMRSVVKKYDIKIVTVKQLPSKRTVARIPFQLGEPQVIIIDYIGKLSK